MTLDSGITTFAREWWSTVRAVANRDRRAVLRGHVTEADMIEVARPSDTSDWPLCDGCGRPEAQHAPHEHAFYLVCAPDPRTSTITPPEGYTYCWCPTCGNVKTARELPWCLHHSNGSTAGASGGDGSGWTRMVPVTVVQP